MHAQMCLVLVKGHIRFCLKNLMLVKGVIEKTWFKKNYIRVAATKLCHNVTGIARVALLSLVLVLIHCSKSS